MASPNTIAAKLHEAARGRTSMFPQIIHSGPWAIGFTRQGAGDPPAPLNILSVKLRPGCSTTPADWKFLGGLVAAMGVPQDVADAEIESDTEDAPRGSYYYLWRDDVESRDIDHELKE